MRDALGGTVIISIIVVFIVLVLSYLAFNVNYTKAFRMKNKIISVYDDYEGKCSFECYDEIKKYAGEIGYGFEALISCGNDNFKSDKNHIFCYRDVKITKDIESSDGLDKKYLQPESKTKHYYVIATRIKIDLPIVKNIIPQNSFWVTGNTKSYYEE